MKESREQASNLTRKLESKIDKQLHRVNKTESKINKFQTKRESSELTSKQKNKIEKQIQKQHDALAQSTFKLNKMQAKAGKTREHFNEITTDIV